VMVLLLIFPHAIQVSFPSTAIETNGYVFGHLQIVPLNYTN